MTSGHEIASVSKLNEAPCSPVAQRFVEELVQERQSFLIELLLKLLDIHLLFQVIFLRLFPLIVPLLFRVIPELKRHVEHSITGRLPLLDIIPEVLEVFVELLSYQLSRSIGPKRYRMSQ